MQFFNDLGILVEQTWKDRNYDEGVFPEIATQALAQIDAVKEIRPILPGRQFIHSLFHLDRQSVTITVRTHECLNALPQFDYLKPYLVVHPFYEDSKEKYFPTRRLQLIKKNHLSESIRVAKVLSNTEAIHLGR